MANKQSKPNSSLDFIQEILETIDFMKKSGFPKAYIPMLDNLQRAALDFDPFTKQLANSYAEFYPDGELVSELESFSGCFSVIGRCISQVSKK